MHDSKQIELFAFAGVVVPSRNDSELFGQAPALVQDSAGFGMMDPELLGFEIEQIETPVRRVANDALVLPRVSH